MYVPPLDLPLEEVRRSLDVLRRPFRVAILRAKNPFNVGAIIRVAHSFLAREIWLVGNAPYYERASMGMERYENIVEVADEDELVQRARTAACPIVVFEREHATVDLWRAPLPDDALLVFGNETDGVPASLMGQADLVVAIPMYGINNSFPVTVAAGIAMAEWSRRYDTPAASEKMRQLPGTAAAATSGPLVGGATAGAPAPGEAAAASGSAVGGATAGAPAPGAAAAASGSPVGGATAGAPAPGAAAAASGSPAGGAKAGAPALVVVAATAASRGPAAPGGAGVRGAAVPWRGQTDAGGVPPGDQV